MRRFLLLLVACAPFINAAGKICPWMNAATASGILGGPVEGVVTKNGPDGTCAFTRLQSGEKLRIEVGAAVNKSPCAAPAQALKAIGNEAESCTVNPTTEQVVGRVRKQAFLITISAGFPAAELHEKILQAAELVTGNLF